MHDFIYYSQNCACLLNQRELLAVMMSDINLLDLDSIRDDFPLASSFKQTQVLEEVLLNLLLNLDQYSDMDKFFSSLNHSLVYLISSVSFDTSARISLIFISAVPIALHRYESHQIRLNC